MSDVSVAEGTRSFLHVLIFLAAALASQRASAAECNIVQEPANESNSVWAYDGYGGFTYPIYYDNFSIHVLTDDPDCFLLGYANGQGGFVSWTMLPMILSVLTGYQINVPGTSLIAFAWLDISHYISDWLIPHSVCNSLPTYVPCYVVGFIVPYAIDVNTLQLSFGPQYHSAWIFPY